MARPIKDGLDYFPLDVDFLEDKKVKLIKAEFGAVGVLILLALLFEIYRDNGYYKRWDSDDCFLMSEGVGCGCSPNTVAEVVRGCVRRSFFDEGVFNLSGVLTSAGIQRRYLRAVAERSNITMIEEYFLLDPSNGKDVPEGIRKKIAFLSASSQHNGVNRPKNGVDLPNNPQRKGKQRKEKQNKETFYDDDDPCAAVQEMEITPQGLLSCLGIKPTGIERQTVEELLEEFDGELVNYAFYRAVVTGNKNLAYAQGILSELKRRGVKNMAHLAQDHLKREQMKNRRG